MPPVEATVLERARQRFSDFDHVPIGLAVLGPALNVLFWNSILETTTGIDRSRALGHTLAELNPVWGKVHYAGRLSHLFAGGPPVVFSPLLNPKIVPQVGNSKRSFHVKATAVPDGEQGWWAILSVEDVTILSKRVEELRDLQVQQNRLMREIHHRVKNNLNMIAGLISMQRAQEGNEAAQGPLNDLQSRIVAISEIHDVLYHSSSLSAGSTAEYLEHLARLLNENLSLSTNHRLELDLDHTIVLKTDHTVLLGLIQAELFTNALKYGLGHAPSNEVLRIRLARLGPKMVSYELSHSGNRLPASFSPATTPGLGMVLLTSYAAQLGSELQWEAGDATKFWLHFSE